MNLRATILKEHSRNTRDKIIKWVGNSQQRFDELFELFITDEDLVMQRAAWPVSYIIIAQPQLIQKHFDRLIKNLGKSKLHAAVKRNTVRLLQDIDIPQRFHGDIMNICFNYVASPEEPAAVKAFSLTILQNLSDQYPEIRNELKLIIDERWNYETAAFRSRARKILKEFSS